MACGAPPSPDTDFFRSKAHTAGEGWPSSASTCAVCSLSPGNARCRPRKFLAYRHSDRFDREDLLRVNLPDSFILIFPGANNWPIDRPRTWLDQVYIKPIGLHAEVDVMLIHAHWEQWLQVHRVFMNHARVAIAVVEDDAVRTVAGGIESERMSDLRRRGAAALQAEKQRKCDQCAVD